MASVNVEITGDARQLEAAFTKIEAGQGKVEAGFDSVAEAGKKSAEKVAGEFGAVGDAGKDSARQIESANEAAATKGAGSYGRLLAELKKHGPEGRAQAKAIEAHLQAAGKGGRRSMNLVIEEIKEFDPAAAEAAEAIETNMDSAAESGKAAFGGFADSAVGKIATIAAGFLSVKSVIGSVNDYLRTQEALIDASLTKQIKLATAQQEASKNLAAFTAVERDELLQRAVPEIMRETGFSDDAQVTLALGTAASSGANAEQSRAAVAAAARVERLTPQNLPSTATGAVSVMENTGLQDPREAIALLQTTGSQAKITEANQLIANFPKALGAAVASVRAQDTEEAARQGAALFAQFTQGGNDTQGTTTASFTIDFTNRLNKFFSEIEKQRVSARSELVTLERKKDPLEKDVVRMDQLRSLIPALERTEDPGTLFGRVEALQQDDALQKQFVGEGFGEKPFQVVLKEVFDPLGDAARGLKEKFELIKADAGFFEQQAEAQASMTPQLRVANAEAAVTAAINAQQSFDNESATLGQVRKITKETLAATNPGGFAGFIDSITDNLRIPFIGDLGIERGSLGGSDAANEGISAIQRLQQSRRGFARDGIDETEAPKVATLDAAIAQLEKMIVGQADVLSESSVESAVERARSGATAERQIERELELKGATEQSEISRQNREQLERLATLLEQQLAETREAKAAQQQTAENTKPRPARENTGDIIRSAAVLNDSRAPR